MGPNPSKNFPLHISQDLAKRTSISKLTHNQLIKLSVVPKLKTNPLSINKDIEISKENGEIGSLVIEKR